MAWITVLCLPIRTQIQAQCISITVMIQHACIANAVHLISLKNAELSLLFLAQQSYSATGGPESSVSGHQCHSLWFLLGGAMGRWSEWTFRSVSQAVKKACYETICLSLRIQDTPILCGWVAAESLAATRTESACLSVHLNVILWFLFSVVWPVYQESWVSKCVRSTEYRKKSAQICSLHTVVPDINHSFAYFRLYFIQGKLLSSALCSDSMLEGWQFLLKWKNIFVEKYMYCIFLKSKKWNEPSVWLQQQLIPKTCSKFEM